jgi:serine protease Do
VRRAVLPACCLALLLVGASPLLTTPSLARGPDSVADVAEGLQDSVVNISSTQTLKGSKDDTGVGPGPKGSPFEEFFDDFFDEQDKEGLPRKVSSLGSGFVIDPSGLIVTNNHVIEGADEILINFTDGTKLKVTKILGHDPKTDLALLKVEPKKPLHAVTFGDSAKMRVGDWVMAIGNPFGLGGSVTVGIISATKRDINAGPYDDFLQTDAAINRGNSGGPLFNMDGQVIVVNTAIISPSGGSICIGFAVPSNSAVQVIDQLKQYGETRRGWLGVHVQNVTDEIAESLGLNEPKGALVATVSPDSPAATAGIQPSDVILSFDGQAIENMRSLPRAVAATPIGKSVAVQVLRKGQTMDVNVSVGQLPASEEAADNSTPSRANLNLKLRARIIELPARIFRHGTFEKSPNRSRYERVTADGAFPTIIDSKYCPACSLSVRSPLPFASVDDTYRGWIGSLAAYIANSLPEVRSTTLKSPAVESRGTCKRPVRS